MATRIKHYVTFYSPGLLFAESSSLPIDSWDTRAAVGLAEGIRERHGARPYGFKFETRIEADPVSDGHGGTLDVQSKTTRESGMHFLGGTLDRYDDVKARALRTDEILLSNMRCNGYWIVCVTTDGYKATNHFAEGDSIVGADGAFIERGDDQKHVAYRRKCQDEKDAEYRAKGWIK